MRLAVVVVLAACSSSPAKPTPQAPPANDCSSPTRACALAELARATPDLDAFARTVYGEHGTRALAMLREHRLEHLVVDPGVVTRIAELRELVVRDRLSGDPWRVRAKLSSALGTKRVYRGMALDDAAKAAVKARGILAASVRAGAAPPLRHLLDQVRGHLMGYAGDADTLISVSEDPKVARCVAKMYAKEADKHVYLYALDMPVIDLLPIDRAAPFCQPPPAPASVDCRPLMSPAPLSAELAQVMCLGLYERAVETFVQGQIDPASIVEVSEPTAFDDCPEVMAATKHSIHEGRERIAAVCKPK